MLGDSKWIFGGLSGATVRFSYILTLCSIHLLNALSSPPFTIWHLSTTRTLTNKY